MFKVIYTSSSYTSYQINQLRYEYGFTWMKMFHCWLRKNDSSLLNIFTTNKLHCYCIGSLLPCSIHWQALTSGSDRPLHEWHCIKGRLIGHKVLLKKWKRIYAHEGKLILVMDRAGVHILKKCSWVYLKITEACFALLTD